VRIHIQTIESQPFSENSYIVWQDGWDQAFVIDAGFEPEVILEELASRDLDLVAIVNTHGHVDHIAGNRAMKEAYPDAPIIIGVNDANMLIDPEWNLSQGYGIPVTSPPRDRVVVDGDVLQYAGVTMTVRDVPGHSPGHVVFVVEYVTPMIVFGGDVLFRGSIGRTDFPNGSLPHLLNGIRTKLFVLADDTIVYPGHGPVTTIGHEKRTNPYLAARG
jgi:hydroxyacylglutathione hydrolase